MVQVWGNRDGSQDGVTAFRSIMGLLDDGCTQKHAIKAGIARRHSPAVHHSLSSQLGTAAGPSHRGVWRKVTEAKRDEARRSRMGWDGVV